MKIDARASLLLAALWAVPAAAQDDFSAFEEMEKKAFAAFEEADRGVRVEWERREEELARTWSQERAALLKRYGIVEAQATEDPLREVETKAPAKGEVAQSEVDFAAGTVKVEAVAVAATEAEARQKAEKLAKATLQEAVGEVPVVEGKNLADKVAAAERDKSVSSTHDEKEKSSVALKDGQVEARVRLEQPLNGENGLTALALENTSEADVPPVAPPEPTKPELTKPEPTKPEPVAAPEPEPAPEAVAAPEPAAPEKNATAIAQPEAPAAAKPVAPAAPAPQKTVAAPAADKPAVPAAPESAGPYTGLLLDATGVPGARPALVPTVRGTSGVLVYGPATVKKERAIHGMAKWLRAESEVEEATVLGKNPLRLAVASMKRGGGITIADADTARLKAADSGFLADCKVAVLLGK